MNILIAGDFCICDTVAHLFEKGLCHCAWESWIKNNSKYITMDYQPYRSRLTQGLVVRGYFHLLFLKRRNIVLLII